MQLSPAEAGDQLPKMTKDGQEALDASRQESHPLSDQHRSDLALQDLTMMLGISFGVEDCRS